MTCAAKWASVLYVGAGLPTKITPAPKKTHTCTETESYLRQEPMPCSTKPSAWPHQGPSARPRNDSESLLRCQRCFSTAERSFRQVYVLPGVLEHGAENVLVGFCSTGRAEVRRGYVVNPVHRVRFWSITVIRGGESAMLSGTVCNTFGQSLWRFRARSVYNRQTLPIDYAL